MNEEHPNKVRSIVRIKDIAEKAGISTGTVDRILHNRGRVSEEVKERVLAIARELNYEPNMLARALVSKRDFKIAALVPDPSNDVYWEAPKKGIEKAEKEFRQYGVVVTLHFFNLFDVESFKRAAEEISETECDGILAAPLFYRESLTYMNRWKRMGIPFILFNTHIPDYEPLSYIGQDSYQSGILAAKLLHYGQSQPGKLIVAHIDEDVQNSSHLIKKEQGFFDYFSQLPNYNNPIVHAELNGSCDKQVFHSQLDELLRNNPQSNGIFVTTSKAYAIAEWLQANNQLQIRLVGYDLLENNLHYLKNGIISFLINQNPEGQGYYGIYSLVDHLIFKKKVPSIKYLPLDIITWENLHYYIESV